MVLDTKAHDNKVNNDIYQKKIYFHGIDPFQILGLHDNNLRIIEDNYDAKVVVRGNELKLEGLKEEVIQLEHVFQELITIANKNTMVTANDVNTVIKIIKSNNNTGRENNVNVSKRAILYTNEGSISPKSQGQQQLYESAYNNDIVFVIGPAGTGKTYLAVAIAIAHLRDKLVSKIVLARPAVEAGESLGYLPGDLLDKIDPYLKPLYDALFDMLLPAKLKKYMEAEIIEVVPLAYMRGRTLNNAFVILDEAQNTNPNQMKMFLTRLGINSKAIITGDVTQIDLPNKKSSGLVQIQEILKGIEGIDFVYLTDYDVVRHKLVREIIKAYDRYDEKEQAK